MKHVAVISLLTICIIPACCQTLLFDAGHGQRPIIGVRYNEIFGTPFLKIRTDSTTLSDKELSRVDGLILFSPTQPLQSEEIQAVVAFVRKGGKLLLIMDEERRTPLHGINGILIPFDLELTENTLAPHNCGAVAEPGTICKGRRELPYSGGRSVKGGTVISRVFAEGGYVHSAYTNIPGGGRIIVMSDGMAGLLLGEPDGVRLQGTSPDDTTYWGKDSEIFMKEILAFLISDL